MIKIWDGDNVEQDIYLYLKHNSSPKGVTVCAKDRAGNHLYDILTIHDGGVHFHNLKYFKELPFLTAQAGFEPDAKRISISRI